MNNEADRAKVIGVLETMVCGISRYPDEVHVVAENDELGVKLTINANKADYGAIIGREGNTIRAIRTIMRSVGASVEARLGVVIAGDQRPAREAFNEQPARGDGMSKPVMQKDPIKHSWADEN